MHKAPALLPGRIKRVMHAQLPGKGGYCRGGGVRPAESVQGLAGMSRPVVVAGDLLEGLKDSGGKASGKDGSTALL